MIYISLILLSSIVSTLTYNPLCIKPQIVDQCKAAKCYGSTRPNCVETATPYSGSNQCCDEDMIHRLVVSRSFGQRGRRNVNGQNINNRMKRQAYNFDKYPKSKWNLTINYLFNNSVTVEMRNKIQDAIKIVESVTCIRFQQLFTVPLAGRENYMAFILDQSCVSFVGKSDEQVSPILGTPECFNQTGTILYLITQSLGMWHQSQRSDSLNYIRINNTNVNPSNFEDLKPIYTDDLVTFGYPYDFASIMSFPPKIFSINGKETITTIDSGFKNTIGQRVEYSFLDAKLLNKLYCNGICANQLNCSNGGFTDPLNCNACRCPEGFYGTFCDVIFTPSSTLVDQYDCGGELVAKYTEKFIYSPGYLSQRYYPLNSTCIWHIRGDISSKLRMRFVDDFGMYIDELSACQHWVEVKYTSPLNSTAYRYCAYTRPTTTMFADSNEAIVVFKSKMSNVPTAFRRGFKLAYKLVCDETTCQNGGVCYNESCKCSADYFGIQCEQGGSSLCEPNPCKNNGTCVLLSSNNFTCQCLPSFTGQFCQLGGPNVCNPSPCKNNGTCVPLSSTNFTCQCLPMFTGQFCDIVSTTNDSCHPNPCRNNGTCIRLSSTSFMCKCLPNLFGNLCEGGTCGACSIYAGIPQEKCCTTGKSNCFKVVYSYYCSRTSCSHRPFVKNYPCSNSSFCCDNSVEMDGKCYAIGWSKNGPCSKSCGGGIAQQQRYAIVIRNQIKYYEAVESRTTTCNEFVCPSYDDSSSSDDYGYGHNHHWWNKK